MGSDGERGLQVQWQVGEDGIVLTWTEDAKDTGEQAPGKRGFGSVLVETSVRQLRGTLDTAATNGKFRLEMRLPAGVVRRD